MPRTKRKSKLRHWFLPHAANDHRPHLIRAHGLAIVALLVLGIQGTSYVLQPSSAKLTKGGHVLAYATDINPSDLLTKTNQERAKAGLSPLHLDAHLNSSAGLKGTDMFTEDYWAHVSPSGIEPWYWFGKAGYAYSYAGENLAKDFDTSAGVMAGWMNSPGHKANILNPHYVDVGFAVQNGILVGGETTLVVAHYGAPGSTVVAAPAPKAPPVAPAPAVKSATAQPPAAPAAPPTTTPVATASPTVVPQPLTANKNTAPTAPPPKSYSLFAPLALTSTLNWATIITLLLLLVLLVVYVYTHFTVWRKGLVRWEKAHYKLFAALQVSGLTAIILLIATSGFGQVG
jgi:hypothetical protein